MGGWTISGWLDAFSGNPLSVNAGNNTLGFGGDTNDHADAVGKVSYPHTAAQWFNPVGAFAPQFSAGALQILFWSRRRPFAAPRQQFGQEGSILSACADHQGIFTSDGVDFRQREKQLPAAL